MDDGDILRSVPSSSSVKTDLSSVVPVDPTSSLVHQQWNFDLSYLNTLTPSEVKRFLLWRRTSFPKEVVRAKLAEYVSGFSENDVVVLSTMAKCYLAKTIESVREKQMEMGVEVNNAISVSDLFATRSVSVVGSVI